LNGSAINLAVISRMDLFKDQLQRKNYFGHDKDGRFIRQILRMALVTKKAMVFLIE
jgi:hypothetical protein